MYYTDNSFENFIVCLTLNNTPCAGIPENHIHVHYTIHWFPLNV